MRRRSILARRLLRRKGDRGGSGSGRFERASALAGPPEYGEVRGDAHAAAGSWPRSERFRHRARSRPGQRGRGEDDRWGRRRPLRALRGRSVRVHIQGRSHRGLESRGRPPGRRCSRATFPPRLLPGAGERGGETVQQDGGGADASIDVVERDAAGGESRHRGKAGPYWETFLVRGRLRACVADPEGERLREIAIGSNCRGWPCTLPAT